MRLKHFLIALIAVLYSLNFSEIVQGQVNDISRQVISRSPAPLVLAQTQSSGQPLVFGYVEDGQPVSSPGSYDPSGYCGDLKKYLKQFYTFASRDVALRYENRFKRYEGVAIECGPNTITPKRIQERLLPYNGSFSSPFFTTGAKLIIRNDKRYLLNAAMPSFTIGVIGDTTTLEAVKNIYPTATPQPIGDRGDAKDKLESRQIDAYISDEILLASILKELPRGYSIEPKVYEFTHESYGVVVYDNPDLLRVINNWISDKGQGARNKLKWKVSNYNWISAFLKFLVSWEFFYFLATFLIFFSLLSTLTHPAFIYLVLKAIPSKWGNRALQGLKTRASRKGSKDPLVVFGNSVFKNEVFTVIAHQANSGLNLGFIDKDTAVKLVQEVGIQTLLQRYQEGSGLSPDEAERRVEKDIAQRAKGDSQFSKMLVKWLDAAGSTASTETARRIVENVLNQDRN